MNLYYINEDQLAVLKTVLQNSEAWDILVDIQTKQKLNMKEYKQGSIEIIGRIEGNYLVGKTSDGFDVKLKLRRVLEGRENE